MFWGKRSSDRIPTPAEALSGHVEAWEELAIDYLDGQLDPRTRDAIDRHLAGCSACASRLQLQQVAIDYMQALPLKDAPPALEAAVVSEALFPSRATQPVRDVGLERPAKWSDTWQRKRNSWLPASAIVAAVLVALVGFAVLRSGAGSMDEAARTTAVAAGDAYTNIDGSILGTAAMPEDAQYVGATEGTAPPTGTATTLASAITMTGATDDAATIKAAEPAPIQDRAEMIGGMTAVPGSPAYFVFESASAPIVEGLPKEAAEGGTPDSPQTTIPSPITGAGDTFVTVAQSGTIAAQITALTGLYPLDKELGLSRPTFAAYVPKDQAPQFIDLLRAIAASEGLVVALDLMPEPAVMEWTNLLLQRKNLLAVLSAQRTPAPAVSYWSFTTSTLLPPTTDAAPPPQLTTPDEAGTHVLVVILVNTLP